MRHLRWMTAAAVALILTACAAFGANAQGERLTRMQASPRWHEGGFVNTLPMAENDWGLLKILEVTRDWWTNPAQRVPVDPVPVTMLSAADFAAPSTGLTVRWFGHSALLIEIEGKRILTDPVWSNRASPVSWAGPERFYPPLIPVEALLPLDAVIISHDHYDHLDMETIRRLKDHTHFYVPLGVGAHLAAWGVAPERIHELDWWERAPLGPVTLVCTPARHFSGRSLTDRNSTLWASWSVVGARHRAYFGGDSGLFPELSEIGERLGPFDVTMLDSGAYNRQWPDVHMGPEQAVVAHRALRGRVFLPIHWGLFSLAPHAWVEPIERVRVVAEREQVAVAQPKPGGLVDLLAPLPRERWWPAVAWKTAEEAPVRSSHIDPAWLARYSKPAVERAHTAGVPRDDAARSE